MAQPHLALVIDDDDDIRELLVHVLEMDGHDVVSAATGEEGVALARERDPDLVTLDLTLPDLDGTEVCRRIREFSDAYIIMITGRSAEIDRLVGLEGGADDYVAKPFSPKELRARAAALLRRPRSSGTAAVASTATASAGPLAGGQQIDLGGGLVLVPTTHLVMLGAEPVPMTPAETELLAALASRPGRTWERGELVREVWQGDFIESDFLVDVHVASVRRKLKAASGGRDWIRTVGGAGYCFSPV